MENKNIYNDDDFNVNAEEETQYYNSDKNTVPDGSNNAGNVIGWMEKLGNFINKQGLKNTFLTIMLLFLCIVVGYYAFNPMAIIERVEVSQTKAHNESIIKRKNADQIVRSSIVEMRNRLGAQRSFVFETHNGGQNLAGLPFLYVDMTYDEPLNNMKRLQDEYKNVSQTRYKIIDQIFNANFWCGDVSKIESVDKELYYRMLKEDVTYLAILILYGEYNIIGAVGITYNNPDGVEPIIADESVIRREMYKYGSQITKALLGE